MKKNERNEEREERRKENLPVIAGAEALSEAEGAARPAIP
jgi:hypothetical protein